MIRLRSENRANGLSYITITDPAGVECGSFSLATPDWQKVRAELETLATIHASDWGHEATPEATPEAAPEAAPAPKRRRKAKPEN